MADDRTQGDLLDALEQLAEEGRLGEARELVERLGAVDAPADKVRLARVLDLALGRAAEAEALYRAALPDAPEALADLTLLLDEQGRRADAEDVLRAQAPAVEAQARVARGRHYRAEEENGRALMELSRGVELEDATALRYLAGALSYDGREQEAKRLYAAPPFPVTEPRFRLDYVDFLRDLDERAEAIAELEQLRAEGVAGADRVLADVLAEDGEVDRAVAHYLVEIQRGDLQALTNLGVTWLGDDDRGAEWALRRAWRQGDALAGRALGRLAMRRGRVAEARELWAWAAQRGDETSTELLDALGPATGTAPDAGSPAPAWDQEPAAARRLCAALGPPPTAGGDDASLSPDAIAELHAHQLLRLQRAGDDAPLAPEEHLRLAGWGATDAARTAAIRALRGRSFDRHGG